MAGLSALSFASPLILLALASLPVIWLLLRATPPAPQRIKFPAFILLRSLQKTEETPDKTPWWLLLLRLIIAGLVILGLAGPILNAPPASPTAGPLILVVDDTWAAAAAWRLRSDALLHAAAETARSERATYVITTAPRLEPLPDDPLTGEELRDLAGALRPQPLRADRKTAMPRAALLAETLGGNAEIRWLSDGVASPDDAAFAAALDRLGDLTLSSDAETPVLALRSQSLSAALGQVSIERLSPGSAWTGELVAMARDGREIARQPVAQAEGEKTTDAVIDLPLALRNDISLIRLDGAPSAGAVSLADARNRQSLIGFLESADRAGNALLSGSYYVTRALEPYASFVDDTLQNLIDAGVSVIVLDDVGRLRERDVELLTAFIEDGGVLVRFAGATLAEAAQEFEPPLLPVSLRGGGRAFGGALSWETPQLLGPFAEDGPFSDLTPPDDVFVKRQVLANPGGETSARTWASLKDGTPLVTGIRQGAGALVLFHVTATPDWSDLPLSGIFIEMLRKLTFLSVVGPEHDETEAGARLAPLRILDGFGAFAAPAPELVGVTPAQAAEGPKPTQPPGFYGSPEAPLAINAFNPGDSLTPITLPGVRTTPYAETPPVNLAAPLFIIALLLLLADAFATLMLGGKLRLRAAALAFCVFFPAPDISAQPLDPEIERATIDAALTTRLAYVRTGDTQIDRLSERGLAALSRELTRRTAVEPAAPAGIDPETDDLSVYPLLYWPITPNAGDLSDAALTNIETYMRFGGLIVFDTRDDERAVAGLETPERAALRAILSRIDVPPLIALPEDHVLTRSFYLLPDLPGRMQGNPVWVQAVGGANDDVTPLIIGGRDWAGAWASDEIGRPVLPMTRGGPRAREISYRAGVNIVMVALTGNYKSDQVHTPILLQRLGR